MLLRYYVYPDAGPGVPLQPRKGGPRKATTTNSTTTNSYNNSTTTNSYNNGMNNANAQQPRNVPRLEARKVSFWDRLKEKAEDVWHKTFFYELGTRIDKAVENESNPVLTFYAGAMQSVINAPYTAVEAGEGLVGFVRGIRSGGLGYVKEKVSDLKDLTPAQAAYIAGGFVGGYGLVKSLSGGGATKVFVEAEGKKMVSLRTGQQADLMALKVGTKTVRGGEVAVKGSVVAAAQSADDVSLFVGKFQGAGEVVKDTMRLKQSSNLYGFGRRGPFVIADVSDDVLKSAGKNVKAAASRSVGMVREGNRITAYSARSLDAIEDLRSGLKRSVGRFQVFEPAGYDDFVTAGVSKAAKGATTIVRTEQKASQAAGVSKAVIGNVGKYKGLGMELDVGNVMAVGGAVARPRSGGTPRGGGSSVRPKVNPRVRNLPIPDLSSQRSGQGQRQNQGDSLTWKPNMNFDYSQARRSKKEFTVTPGQGQGEGQNQGQTDDQGQTNITIQDTITTQGQTDDQGFQPPRFTWKPRQVQRPRRRQALIRVQVPEAAELPRIKTRRRQQFRPFEPGDFEPPRLRLSSSKKKGKKDDDFGFGKKKKKRKKGMVIGVELDYLALTVLDTQGVRKAKIKAKEFEKLWRSGQVAMGEPETLAGVENPFFSNSKKKGRGRW